MSEPEDPPTHPVADDVTVRDLESAGSDPVSTLCHALLVVTLRRGASHLRLDLSPTRCEALLWRDGGWHVETRMPRRLCRSIESCVEAMCEPSLCEGGRRAALRLALTGGRRRDFRVFAVSTTEGPVLLLRALRDPYDPGVDAAVEETFAGMAPLEEQKRWSEADALARGGLARLERAFGPEDLAVGWVLEMVAWHRVEMGDAAEAERCALRARAIWERWIGAPCFDLARCLRTLSCARAALDHPAEGEALAREALGIVERIVGPDDGVLVQHLLVVAAHLAARGAHDESESTLVRALAIAERDGGDPESAARVRMRLAELRSTISLA